MTRFLQCNWVRIKYQLKKKWIINLIILQSMKFKIDDWIEWKQNRNSPDSFPHHKCYHISKPHFFNVCNTIFFRHDFSIFTRRTMRFFGHCRKIKSLMDSVWSSLFSLKFDTGANPLYENIPECKVNKYSCRLTSTPYKNKHSVVIYTDEIFVRHTQIT